MYKEDKKLLFFQIKISILSKLDQLVLIELK